MSCGCLGRAGQCVTHPTAGLELAEKAGSSSKQAQAGSVQDEKAVVECCALTPHWCKGCSCPSSPPILYGVLPILVQILVGTPACVFCKKLSLKLQNDLPGWQSLNQDTFIWIGALGFLPSAFFCCVTNQMICPLRHSSYCTTFK